MLDVFGLRFDLAAFEEVARDAAAEVADARTAGDLAIALTTLGIPALTASVVIAGLLGARPLPLLALGGVPIALAFLFHVQTHDPATCHDCYTALDGAYHPIELAAATFNVVAWTAGAIVGLAARALARRVSSPSHVAASRR
jgi:hypothetical protein